MKTQIQDKEYTMPLQYGEGTEKYGTGKDEYGAVGEEYSCIGDEYISTAEESGSGEGTRRSGDAAQQEMYHIRKKRRQAFYLKFVSAVLAMLLLMDVFEMDFLREPDVAAAETQETPTEETHENVPEESAKTVETQKPEPVSPVETEEPTSGEHADKAFPILENLMPGGSTQSVLLEKRHEQRVDENGQTYQYTPSEDYSYPYYVGEFAEFNIDRGVAGASYDAATNTLTLENCYFEGDLYATRMGNGFTIRLIGENHLDSIFVDASDYQGGAYAAALTITGDGSLEVSDPTGYSGTGIYLSAGGGDGCIMIDSGVTLEVTGNMYAIHVFDTTAEKGIYYLEPLQIQDGIMRDDGVENMMEDGTIWKNFSLTTGTARDDVTHVVFAPAEN